MPISTRLFAAVTALVGMLAAAGWALHFATLPPADFVFVNGTEIKSVDPALVTGQPEGRIVNALFEGLVRWQAETIEPIPAVAESWEISADKRVYSFQLRDTALWSDGTPITSGDFLWSWRRMLDPHTASEYGYQLWYIKNAKRYFSADVHPGDRVEIELAERPAGALPYARGKLLHGELREVLAADEPAGRPKAYVVEIDGQTRRFAVADDAGKAGAESCVWLTLDFAEVGLDGSDPLRLQITLNEPTAYFLTLMGFFPLLPIQSRCYETFGKQGWTKPENIVTGGPYHLASRRLRDRMRLVKSPTYWDRDNVALDIIDSLAVESPSTALNLYLTGQVDWIPNVPPTIVGALMAQDRPDFHPAPESSTYFYRLNVDRPPLDNPLVRRALAHSIDRKEIVDSITQAGELIARSIVPPGMPGYDPPEGLAYDLVEARRLLAEAGYPGGQGFPKLTILYNTDDAHQLIAELIQDRWKRELGIRVDLQNREWSAFLSSLTHLEFSIARSAWTSDYLDPNTFLDMFVTDGANNQTGFSSPEYDKLIAQAADEPDAAERMRILRSAETLLLAAAPIIPIYFRSSKNMVRPYVHGFYENLQDNHPLNALSVDRAEQQRLRAGGSR